MAIFNLPIARVGDDNFRVGSGYKLYFYKAGTLTAKDTFTDNTYATPLANPVVADGNGRFSVIWTTGDYKVILKTDEDVTVWTVDNYSNDTSSNKFAEGVLSAAGSAPNVITANLPTTPGSLVDQLQVVVELQHGANTIVNPTFSLNGLPTTTIKRDTNQPLAIGDTGGDGYKIYLSYSDTNGAWILLNPANPIGHGLNWKRGLKVTNNATDAAHDIDIATGSILDITETRIISLTSAITKQIDANWAEGDDAGGFPSGLTIAADACYRVFLIAKADGTGDAGFDTSATATNLLADATTYTYYRRVGWVITDSSSNIIAFVDGGNNVTYLDVPVVVSTTSSTTARMETVIAPPDVPAILSYRGMNEGSNIEYGLLTQTDQTDSTPSATIFTLKLDNGAADDEIVDSVVMEIKTDSSRQVRHRENEVAMNIALLSLGYRDDLTVG